MSANATPIPPTRFAAALTSLSLSSLYAKVSELRNSITHLETSNAELEAYVRAEADKDCYEALIENRDVIARMRERIELVRKEVTEVRALPWMPEDEQGEAAKGVEVGERRADGEVEMSGGGGGGGGAGAARERENGGGNGQGAAQQPGTNGTQANGEGGEDGVFL